MQVLQRIVQGQTPTAPQPKTRRPGPTGAIIHTRINEILKVREHVNHYGRHSMHPVIHSAHANSCDRDAKQLESAKYLFWEIIHQQFLIYAHQNAVLRNLNSTGENRQVIEKSHEKPDERLQLIIDWVERFDKDPITAMAEQWQSNIVQHQAKADSKH
jgi:hypothetical protein